MRVFIDFLINQFSGNGICMQIFFTTAKEVFLILIFFCLLRMPFMYNNWMTDRQADVR